MSQGALSHAVSPISSTPKRSASYLESSSQSENTVICFFRWQSLECKLYGIVFFGDQIVGSKSCLHGQRLDSLDKKLS